MLGALLATKEDLKAYATKAVGDRIINLGRDIRSVLDNHERRITNLETSKRKRRQRSGRN
jgi:hypothetical protein